MAKQDREWRLYQKPFKAKAYASKGSIPGRIISKGTEKLKILIHAEDAPIPEEMFKVMDLHKQAESDKPGFIGWIGGTIAKGGRTVKDPNTGKEVTTASTMFVDEAQSDLLQTTNEFLDPEKYKANIADKLASTTQEYSSAYKELQQLKKEYADSTAYIPLARKLELQQRIDELEDEVKKQSNKWGFQPKYPQYNEFKNKLENYYGDWINAFFNAALDYAKDQSVKYLAIASAAKILATWPDYGQTGGKAQLFDRVYDKTAIRWGMQQLPSSTADVVKKRSGISIAPSDWWIGEVGGLQALESLDVELSNVVETTVE